MDAELTGTPGICNCAAAHGISPQSGRSRLRAVAGESAAHVSVVYSSIRYGLGGSVCFRRLNRYRLNCEKHALGGAELDDISCTLVCFEMC